jgi:CheY-like chemotaxis protein
MTMAEVKPYVLLVEDHDELRWMLGDVLRQAGIPVLTARDGADALNILRTVSEPPVMVFTDLSMPRMDGRALVQALQQDEALRKIPIVVLTGDENPSLPADSHFLLRKPIETDTVRRLALAAIRASNFI